MTPLLFRIPMLPRGQGRPRTSVVCGHARIHQSHDDEKAKQTLASLALPYKPEKPLEGPLAVTLVVVLPRPKSLCRHSKRTGRPLDDPGRRWAPTKPDRDNADKLVLDALATFWRDDAQVCFGPIAKFVAALDESPGYEIRIDTLPELPPPMPLAATTPWWLPFAINTNPKDCP